MEFEESSLPVILNGKYFKVISVDKDKKVQANCVICAMTEKPDKQVPPVKGFLNPTSNFTTHLKRLHSEAFAEYEAYISSPEGKRPRKQKGQKAIDFPVVSRVTAKTRFENMILDYIIDDMRPLSTVESAAFRRLVKGLNPDAELMCRKTFKSRLQARYESTKAHITELIRNVDFVCVTTDIWSSTHRSFIGVTCHWIQEDLTRNSAVLSLKRFKGKHTYDKIAELLQDIFTNYNLTNKKIVSVVTDNGSNFVKAFKEYGISDELANMEIEGEMEDPVELLLNLSELLDEGIVLPRHKRCASHTLSLVATCDAEKAVATNQGAVLSYKSTLRSALAKCNGLWNKFSRSPQVAEKISDHCGKSLVTPAATRWNSLFDSIRRLLDIKEKLPQIFEYAVVEKLKPIEIEFLNDYITALQPVAFALDKLQSENDFYYGFLAPTIFQTLKALDKVIENLDNNNFTVPLAQALKSGITTRFANVCALEEMAKEEILAAVTHPYFKLRWLPKANQEVVKKRFTDEAKKFAMKATNEMAGTSDKTCAPVDEFFDFENADKSDSEDVTSVELECLSYLEDKSTDIRSLIKYPTVKAMFKRFNTSLPSSAPAERLFSYGGLVLQPKRARLSDETFEILVFLKLNGSK